MFTTEKAPGELHEQPYREICEGLDVASKLLLNAADYIEELGLSCSGEGIDEDGSVCTLVAIGSCATDIQDIDLALERLRPHVPSGEIVRWSDNSPKHEVLAKLRAVALGS
jgi:hypothetical protein